MFDEISLNFGMRSGAKVCISIPSRGFKKARKTVCKSCRSRQEPSNEYLLAKIRFDTAENGLLKVCIKVRLIKVSIG